MEGVLDTLNEDGQSIMMGNSFAIDVLDKTLSRISIDGTAMRKRVYEDRPLSYAPQLWNSLSRFSFSTPVQNSFDINRLSNDYARRSTVI